MKNAKPELILPGGDLERVKIALEYGADAVYVGLDKHSLRKAEIRFGIDEIKEAIDYAHKRGKRIFVTFNIFAHNKHLADIEKDMKTIATFNPDAFIMADIGVMQIAKRVAPSVPIHISTQANTVNLEDVRFWASQGVKRVVLARELTLDEIKEIHEAVPEVELEVFVHGAMCISYSGRCLMSNYVTGRNANLGECAQPCRWNYRVYSSSEADAKSRSKDEKVLDSTTLHSNNKFFLEEQLRPGEFFPIEETENGTAIMSSKDLRLVRYLPEILDTGVVGLKIEGRNKTAYYVATAASTYRKALDLIEAGKYDEKAKNESEAELEKLNYRDYTTGFIFGEAKQGETYPLRSPIRNWDFVGQVINSYSSSKQSESRSSMADSYRLRSNNNLEHEITVKNQIKKGETLEILTPEGIFTEKVIEILDEDGNEVEVINPGKTGQTATIFLSNGYPVNSFLRKKLL